MGIPIFAYRTFQAAIHRQVVADCWDAGLLGRSKRGQIFKSGADRRFSLESRAASTVGRRAPPCYSVKDPTIVRLGDRWHLFCTIRSLKRTQQIEYLSFADWTEASKA
jgi:hypothetical protein